MQKYSFTNLVLMFAALSSLLMAGCAGTQEKPQAGDIKYVESKALIEDKAKNTSNENDRVWGVVTDGQCVDISDMDMKAACQRYKEFGMRTVERSGKK